MSDRIAAELKVTSCAVKAYPLVGVQDAEVIEIKAQGEWKEGDYKYPISLHVTTYPGMGVIPPIGDTIRVTVERT
jgi:hypothetical protein